MKHPDKRLITPLYVKMDDDMPLPDHESVYYLLGSDGLYLCRNHPLFRSCVHARSFPSELAPHGQTLELYYPRLRQASLEALVGFFAEAFERHASEAAALLLWDRDAQRLRVRVPPQRATVTEGWSGKRYPLDVHYDVPEDLPPQLSPIGTIHSHGDGAAYSSYTDKQDEEYRAGLHVVVGHIMDEPPQFHCEFVVDGVRFRTGIDRVAEGYQARRHRFPRGWLEQLQVEVEKPKSSAAGYYGGTGTSASWHGGSGT